MAGLQIAGSFNKNNLTFTPEIHTEVSYGLNPKSPSGKFSSEFTNNQGTTTFVGSKPSNFSGTIGAGITVSSDRVECGMTYDVNLADKYVGQQISAKMKVKF